MNKRIRGVLAPVVTPFGSDYKPDSARFVRQCQWLQANQVGLAVFGTNSEANSMAAAERMDLLDHLIGAGVDPARLMPGTGTCSLSETVQLSSHAVQAGCAGALVLPPFYYKGVSDEGLYRYFSEVIERVGDARLRIYLYHIPAVSQVGISLPLIERLLKAYPLNIAGAKDSSGDWDNTSAMLKQFSAEGFDVFAGSETILLATMRAGGAGCISATANVNPEAIHRLYEQWQEADADQQQASLNALRAAFQKHPMIPALKKAIAHWGGDEDWARVRPPLVELDSSQEDVLMADLRELDFAMTGLSA